MRRVKPQNNEEGPVLIDLTLNEVEEDPLNLANPNEDLANIIFLLGMKYTGDPDADPDGDGFTNYQEFQIPLPFGDRLRPRCRWRWERRPACSAWASGSPS